MRKLAYLALALLLCLPAAAAATAAQVSSTDLIEDAITLDGQTVTYRGELIGDVLRREDHAWLNLNDGSNAIGVWVDAAALDTALLPGRYGQQGDTLEITGVFHRACPEHGGDMDIHASTVALVQKGFETATPVTPWKWALALAVTAVDVGLLVRYRRARRRE